MTNRFLQLIFSVILIFVSIDSYRKFDLEEDISKSLESKNKTEGLVYDQVNSARNFSNEIFVDFGKNSGSGAYQQETFQEIENAGYKQRPLLETNFEINATNTFFATRIANPGSYFEIDNIEKSVNEAAMFALLPGGSAVLSNFQKDPFSLLKPTLAELSKSISGTNSFNNFGEVVRFRRTGALSFVKVGELYNSLSKRLDRIFFIGADFFAFENYKVIQSDIQLCLVLSIVMNAIIYYFFVRNWLFLVFAIVGTAISYVGGIFFVQLFYLKIHGIVIAFTSTFLGYNIEYLIHLSGVKSEVKKRHKVGMSSAIGTTLIGFLVLLFGSSSMLKQLALASLGGMIFFLIFIYFFREFLIDVNIRILSWPLLKIGNKSLLWIYGILVVLLYISSNLQFKTNISDFGVQSKLLNSQVEHFLGQQMTLGVENPHALEVQGDIGNVYIELQAEMKNLKLVSPLLKYRNIADQRYLSLSLKNKWDTGIALLKDKFEVKGIKLSFIRYPLASEFLNSLDYLKNLSQIFGQPWAVFADGKKFLIFGISGNERDMEASLSANKKVFPLSPKVYFDRILTSLGKEMIFLFGIGIIVMGIYLLFIQKSVWNLIFIFMPVLASAVTLAFYFRLSERNVNVIHIVGFLLVMSVAVDYSSVAISNLYAKIELTKILLTGLSLFSSFGVLVFAGHPVLHDLGITVSLGAGAGLIAALLIQFRPTEANAK